MPQSPINTEELVAKVTAAKTVMASAKALIAGFSAKVTEAVTAALTADDAADQGSIDAANAAIAGATSELDAASADLAGALTANTPSA